MRLPLLQTFAACFAVSAMGAEDVLFNRDVQPILSDKCFACHGFDEKTREADLRLDSFAGATKDTDGVRAIVPGDLAKSEAWLRIITDDEDDLMPPKKSRKKLSDREKDVLKRWIEQGAKYQRHWSLEAPTRAALPAVQKKDWVRNPIDAFVLARLEKEGLAPAPEADRRTLARRVWLDLTGLPPTPEEVNAFVSDPAPDAYERLVRRLMDSPHWGEHRGRYWLDAARYADTHGLHFDNFREISAYRDWVINAFNRNQPFDLFTIEQLAGDLLPKPTREQLIATGFQRCNATTNEGGTIDDENLANYANDRVTTLSWVWFGLSANCAACHDHKFDPITQKDFYSMAAFFRNTTQPPKDGNVRESRPILYLPKQDDEKRFSELQTELAQARDAHGKRRAEMEKQFGEWVKTATPGDLEINPEKLAVHYRLNDNAGSIKGESRTENGVSSYSRSTTVQWQDGGKFGRAPVLPAEGVELGDLGKFEKDQAFSVAAWIKVPQETTVAAVAGRFDDRGPTRQGWVVYLEEGKLGLRISAGDSKNEIRAGTRRALFRGGAWQHIVATYDGSGTAAGIQIAVDGREEAMVPAGEPLKASIAADVPLRLGRRETGQPFTGGSIQDFRIYARKVPGYEIKALQQLPALRRALALPLPPPEPPKTETAEAKPAPAAPAPAAAPTAAPAAPAVAAATTPPAAPAVAEAKKKKRAEKKAQTAAEGEPAFRKPEQTTALLEFYLGNKDAELRRMADQIATLDAEDKAIKSRSAVTLVQEEKPNNEPMANVLMRGQYDKPGDQVPAATFSALHAFPANAPKNRLGLAEWVVAKENPLTARVTVNRFWQELFGTGIVRTSEDFGIMGDLPSHPELLDWLAVDFRESGWDTKRFFMQMVTSATYRQAALLTPEKRERDPHNRLLSRGPRFRMDAEMIRDYALASSATLVPKIGGPSVKPYQPVGVWEAVAMPESNTRNYKPDTGEGLYRRSLYTFWKRAAPPAVMDILNAPSRETCAVRRERTNTPLQALATMNDPQFVEAARRLAELALQKASEDPQKAIAFIAERVLLRPLAEAEQKIVAETYSVAEREFSERPESAKQYTIVGESKPNASLPPVKLAALALVANQLLCLDEALNK